MTIAKNLLTPEVPYQNFCYLNTDLEVLYQGCNDNIVLGDLSHTTLLTMTWPSLHTELPINSEI